MQVYIPRFNQADIYLNYLFSPSWLFELFLWFIEFQIIPPLSIDGF